MAHKKATGTTRLGRDSKSKRLGTKLYDGQIAEIGNILVKQRGSKIRAGKNVKQAKDDSLFAMKKGYVKFTTKMIKKYTGKLEKAKFVNILPTEEEYKKAIAKK